jgi:hypothetical protein
MRGSITVNFDYDDEETFDALQEIIERLAPFMVDNVSMGFSVEL